MDHSPDNHHHQQVNPIDVITKKVSAEGFSIPREILVAHVMGQIDNGQVKLFHYHPVVFTVAITPEYPVVHLYSDSAGHGILRATRQFMKDVWAELDHDFLVAPILSNGVKALAKRAGWKSSGQWYLTGHELFIIERN